MNKNLIHAALGQRPDPVLSFEELQETAQVLSGEVDDLSAEFDADSEAVDQLRESRDDTLALVEAADQMRRSNSVVAHEAFQGLLHSNLAKYGWTLPSMENDEAPATPAADAKPEEKAAEAKDKTEKASGENKNLLQRMLTAVREFFSRMIGHLKQIFEKIRGSRAAKEATVQKAEHVVEEAKAKPEVAKALLVKLEAKAPATKAAEKPAPEKPADAPAAAAPTPKKWPPGFYGINIHDSSLLQGTSGHAAARQLASFQINSQIVDPKPLFELAALLSKTMDKFTAALKEDRKLERSELTPIAHELHAGVAQALSSWKRSEVDANGHRVTRYALAFHNNQIIWLDFPAWSAADIQNRPVEILGALFRQGHTGIGTADGKSFSAREGGVEVAGTLDEYKAITGNAAKIYRGISGFYEKTSQFTTELNGAANKINDGIDHLRSNDSAAIHAYTETVNYFSHNLLRLFKHWHVALRNIEEPYQNITEALVEVNRKAAAQ